MPVIDVLKTELWGISWKLCAAITIAGFLALLWKVIEKKILGSIERKVNERKLKKQEVCQEPEEPTIYQARHGEWSPTGWVYDRETQKWNPPEYLVEEAARKWRWDEEKSIWIDQDKEAHREHYREYWKDKRTEPTYEEWRAAKLAEQKKGED